MFVQRMLYEAFKERKGKVKLIKHTVCLRFSDLFWGWIEVKMLEWNDKETKSIFVKIKRSNITFDTFYLFLDSFYFDVFSHSWSLRLACGTSKQEFVIQIGQM